MFKHTNGSLNSSQVGCRRFVPVSSTCSNVTNFDLHSAACSCIGCVCCRWIVSVTIGNIAPLLSTAASHVPQGWTKHLWCTGARRKTLWRGAKVKQSVGFVLERHIGGFCWYDIGRRVWPYLVARTGEPFLIGLKWRVEVFVPQPLDGNWWVVAAARRFWCDSNTDEEFQRVLEGTLVR